MEAQVVEVEDGLDALRQFEVVADVRDEDAGVDEARLPLRLTAAQGGQKAQRLNESDGRARERDADAVPERELAADEVRVVENRVEARRLIVRRVLVARREEGGDAEALEVFVNRSLGRGHVRAHASLAPRYGVARVRAEREVV